VQIDAVDNHLAQAREFDRACVPLGMYVAWCLNLGLVSETVLREHETMVLRVRMHDAHGSALLVALGGALDERHLNEQGKQFTDAYYSSYMDDYSTLFGSDFYAIPDSWDNYQKLAAVLTAKLLGPKRLRRGSTDRLDAAGLVGKISKGWRKLWH